MSATQRENDKCKQVLKEMLLRPENKYCAECGIKQPTWASTNLGVFICIRCSGIHRNMGTHISKVKSTSLDRWTYKLLRHFSAQNGNVAVNARYENRLPKHLKATESTDNYSLEQFIRNKYDRKKWYSDNVTIRDPPKKQNSRKSTPNKSAKVKSNNGGRIKSKAKKRSAPQPKVSAPQPQPDLLNLDQLTVTPQKVANDSDLLTFVSAKPALLPIEKKIAPTVTAPIDFLQTTPSSGAQKNAILSMYSSENKAKPKANIPNNYFTSIAISQPPTMPLQYQHSSIGGYVAAPQYQSNVPRLFGKVDSGAILGNHARANVRSAAHNATRNQSSVSSLENGVFSL